MSSSNSCSNALIGSWMDVKKLDSCIHAYSYRFKDNGQLYFSEFRGDIWSPSVTTEMSWYRILGDTLYTYLGGKRDSFICRLDFNPTYGKGLEKQLILYNKNNKICLVSMTEELQMISDRIERQNMAEYHSNPGKKNKVLWCGIIISGLAICVGVFVNRHKDANLNNS